MALLFYAKCSFACTKNKSVAPNSARTGGNQMDLKVLVFYPIKDISMVFCFLSLLRQHFRFLSSPVLRDALRIFTQQEVSMGLRQRWKRGISMLKWILCSVDTQRYWISVLAHRWKRKRVNFTRATSDLAGFSSTLSIRRTTIFIDIYIGCSGFIDLFERNIWIVILMEKCVNFPLFFLKKIDLCEIQI